MKRKFWTSDEIKALRELHKALVAGKIEVEDFPKVLKARTASSCRNMMDKLHLNYRMTAQVDFDELRKLTKVSKGV